MSKNEIKLCNNVVTISKKNVEALVFKYHCRSKEALESVVNEIIRNACNEADRSKMIHMDRTQNCTGCEFMKEYNYGKRIYCCDHDDRTDDMGKLSVDYPPDTSPKWCPLKEK